MQSVATVLGSIPASVGTVESEGRQMKQCWIKYEKYEMKFNQFLEHFYTDEKENEIFLMF